MDASSNVVSFPSAWRTATPSRASPLLVALERAAAARQLGIEASWPCIGRYQVRGRLGQGGMSTVWEAIDEQLGRRVAIKVLRSALSTDHELRLRREAQALARLSHPHVVQVYEVIDVDGLTALVMELVQGPTLRQWQQRDPRPGWKSCVEVYLQAGRGLAAAHAAGLVHRDFKPDNCIVDEHGRVRMLDFGLVAREHDEPITTEKLALPSAGDSLELSLTRTGTLMGTVGYMPPEQLGRHGSTNGAAGDQFSFCISLYEAIHGERPFAGASEDELRLAIEDGRIRAAPAGMRVPPRLRAILVRGLAAEPEARWPAMAELLDALERVVKPSRRWPWLGIAVANTVVIGAAVSAMVFEDVERRPCTGASALLEGSWDEPRRQAVEQAIVGTATQHAIETWARLESRLDAYARQWVEKHTEVCEATRVTEVQTEDDMGLRMRCLTGSRAALREVVGVLAQADESARRNAVELVTGLPPLALCDDLERLHAELPPPLESEVAARVEDARTRLSRAHAWREAGAYAQGETEASAVVEEATRLGYDPLLAEALLERGEVRTLLAERGAGHDLSEAYHLAQRLEHRDVETRASIALARFVANDPAQLDTAMVWAQSARSLAERKGMEPLLEAEAASAMGHVRMMRGWLEDEHDRALSLELHHEALALYEAVLSPSHPAIAGALEAVGDVLMKDKDPEGAQQRYERALAIYEAALGPSHPAVGDVLSKLGDALVKQEEPQMALELHERELAIQSAAFGPWHPSVAHAWTRIGIALHGQGRLQEALALHEMALEMAISTLGRDDHAVIGILSEIGFVLRDQGKIEEALRSYDESIAIRDTMLGPRHHSVLMALRNIGRELVDLGMIELAEPYYREALSRCDDTRASMNMRTELMLLLAEVAVARGDHEEAIALVEPVLADFDGLPSSAPSFLYRGRFLLAQALAWDPRQRESARRLAEQARAGFEELVRMDERWTDELEDVERWLAERPAE